MDRRGGLVALFVTALLIYFFLNIQYKKLITFIIMFIISFLIIIKFNNFISILNDDRWQIWQSVLQSYLHGNLLFGSGLDTYKIASKKLSIDIKYNGTSIDSPHNIYLGILHDFGFIGLSSMILLIYKQLSLFYRALSYTNKFNEKIIIMCGFTSYISYLIAAMYDIDFYRPIFVGPTMLIYGIITGYALKILHRSTNE
jgi:O-antigen ligase